jgi:glycosyltransferase involved in cell wall biosynthesis
MKNLKILMVNLGFLPDSIGGTEVYSYQLSKALIQRGYDVTVLTALDDVRLERFKVIHTSFEGIKVVQIVNSSIHARSFVDYFLSPQVDDLFAKLMRKMKPDVIHFQHLAYLSAKLPEMAHRMNIPSILTLHDYWYMCFRSQLLRPGYGVCPGPAEGAFCASCSHKSAFNPLAVPRFPFLVKTMNSPEIRKRIASMIENLPPSFVSAARVWLFKQGDNGAGDGIELLENKFRYSLFKRQLLFPKFVLSPSVHLKHRYEREGFRDIMVLPIGFHPTAQMQRPRLNGKLRIAYIGNVERHKGLMVMLSELAKSRDLHKIEINVHGKSKDLVYFAEVKRLAKKSLRENVNFHGGYRSDTDLKDILAKIHLVVFPSLWEENYPLVIREALLNGVPVIASKIGGAPEIIESGVNGFLFDPYEEGDLSAKINLILTNPRLLDTITEGARNTTVESMEQHVSKLCDLYAHALESREDLRASPSAAAQ